MYIIIQSAFQGLFFFTLLHAQSHLILEAKQGLAWLTFGRWLKSKSLSRICVLI